MEVASVVLLAAAAATRAQSLDVSLTPSVPSPAPLGSRVTWSATAFGGSGNVLYRFRARRAGVAFRSIRDYSSAHTLDWTATEDEGWYDIEATAKDMATGATGSASARYEITPLARDAPAISPTANPLVFLYSAPPCPAQSRMRVRFQSPDGLVQYTPYKECHRGLSMNFYLAGLRPNTTYSVTDTVDTRYGSRQGPTLMVTTSAAVPQVPASTFLQTPATAPADGVLLHSGLLGPAYATDQNGSLIWYYASSSALLTRPEPGGRFLALIANQSAAGGFGPTLREFDLAGNTLRETNTASVNQQLAAMGKPAIGVFHHEAIGLPGDWVAVLGTTERILSGVQGSGQVDILGDVILVLDENLQVVWTWDAFDHLDARRAATLGETCPGSGCPPLSRAPRANDWLHGNALQYTVDGNLLYSTRHQDWIIKIDFRDGAGAGDVLWRLGKDGDFQILSNDPSPWFSHQHGPQFAPVDETMVAVFDDGNLRQAVDRNAHSRGQVLQLDVQNKTAKLVVNADLTGFSFAVGNAQPLENGEYHFGGGWLPDNTSRAMETDASGNVVALVRIGLPEYRSFRMRDMYSGQTHAGEATPR